MSAAFRQCVLVPLLHTPRPLGVYVSLIWPFPHVPCLQIGHTCNCDNHTVPFSLSIFLYMLMIGSLRCLDGQLSHTSTWENFLETSLFSKMSQEGLFQELQQLKYSVTLTVTELGVSHVGVEMAAEAGKPYHQWMLDSASPIMHKRGCLQEITTLLETMTRCVVSSFLPIYPQWLHQHTSGNGFNTHAFGLVSPAFFPSCTKFGWQKTSTPAVSFLFSAPTKILWSDRCHCATDFTCRATPRNSSLCKMLVEFPFEIISNFLFPPNWTTLIAFSGVFT